MARNYPGSKDTWQPASYYSGKSFSTAGGTNWPGDVGDQFEAIQDWVGYFTDTATDLTLSGRMVGIESKHTRTESTFATVPSLADRCITYVDDTAHHDYGLSVASGRLRVTASSSTTNGNMRRAYGHIPSGTLGDSEVRSTIYATNASWSTTGRYQPGHVHRLKSTRVVLDSGLATAGTSTTLTDSGKSWSTSPRAFGFAKQHGREVYVMVSSGTGQGQKRQVITNTATALTVDTAWTTTPDTTSYYEVFTYAVSCIAVMTPIAFAYHSGLQVDAWENNCFSQFGSTAQLDTYFGTPPSDAPLPWKMKSRLVGNTLDAVLWKASDPEPDYGTAGKSGSWTVPGDFADEPGMSGLYVGHLAYTAGVSDWIEFDDVTVTGL